MAVVLPYDVKLLPANHLHRQNAGKTNAETLRGLLGDSFSEAVMQSLACRKENIYREAYRPHIQPVPGLLAFLDQARAVDIPMALATSADQQNIALIQRCS